ncbi:carboxypeptidase regulatory-like domain-containing protein [uncultured Clostridium sp.]|uniref:carboxypeptidase regulatory-like domain-containing protein n=1 Tax=uncultured Clostridium sp. TaxID=59620 RepID=UPI0025E75827|nr:carboxypeptidase regulatory-like domain-containing protein [uncultured Clostridium sp.]
MARVYNTASPPAPEEDESKRRWLLLFLLLSLALITSCVAGYLLGKRAGQKPAGQIIDTILLAPEESAARTRTHLTGRIFYSDGSPAAGRHIELHSEPVSTVTDLDGRFLFPNVSFGEHTITVYNQDGSVDAKQPVTISPDKEEQGVIITRDSNQDYAITVAVDIRILELVIELDDGQITLQPDRHLYADDRGWVTTPSGTASTSSGVIVTPGGAVHLPDGTIVIPNSSGNAAAVILPDDTVIYPDEPITGNGYTVEPDGSVTLADETLIKPDGTITLPGSEIQAPGENGVIINNESVIPIGGNALPIQERQTEADSPSETSGVPDGSSPSAKPNTDAGPDASPDNTAPSHLPDAPAPSDGSESSAVGSGGNSGGGGHGGSHTKNTEASTEGTEPTTEGTEPTTEGTEPTTEGTEPTTESGEGELTFWGNVKDTAHYTPWNQGDIIDLFYNRTGGPAEKIAPGSSGFYRFQLKNTLSRELRLTLDISEGEVHLPLQITLTPLKANGGKLTRQAVSGSITDGKLTLQDKIGANEFITYQLDWEWPFAGNDTADTAIGEAGGIYTLQLLIHAEEN